MSRPNLAELTALDVGRVGTWIGCFSGGRVWPLDLRVEDIRLVDLAHHLAKRDRYGGALRRYLSVAEHCVIVSQYVPEPHRQEGLLHDACEAYIGDMIRPLKHQPEMAGFRAAEDRMYPVMMARFGIVSTEESLDAIGEVDDRIVIDETRALSRRPEHYTERYPHLEPLGCAIAALEWRDARYVFLARFAELFGADHPDLIEAADFLGYESLLSDAEFFVRGPR